VQVKVLHKKLCRSARFAGADQTGSYTSRQRCGRGLSSHCM